MTKLYLYLLAAGLALGTALIGSPSQAASAYKKALDKKLNSYLSQGVVIGGRAGQAFSLLNVRRDLSPKRNMERVILDIGDSEGRPLKGQVSYFQASIEKNPPRVVIDLAQLSRSAVTAAKLQRIFRHSPFVKTAEITADPEDRSATLVLKLKSAMNVEVFEMPSTSHASRIVVDLRAASDSRPAAKRKMVK